MSTAPRQQRTPRTWVGFDAYKVEDHGYETPCWIFQKTPLDNGYCEMTVISDPPGRQQMAHRAFYERHIGPIPEGLTLDHLCRVRSCVNPSHLEPVTRGENTLRGETLSAANAAKTHCPKGHPYDEENTRLNPRGWRSCRTCSNEARRLKTARERNVVLSLTVQEARHLEAWLRASVMELAPELKGAWRLTPVGSIADRIATDLEMRP